MPQWHRTVWMEAVWTCTDLKPLEKLVAGVFADHAGKGMVAFVALTRLCDRSGLSRDAANRALRGLVSKGWLTKTETARQHKATRYGLTIPEEWQDASSTGDVPLDGAAVRETDGWDQRSSTPHDASSTGDDTSSTPRVPDPSSIQVMNHPPRARASGTRAIAAELMSIHIEDPILDHLQDVLKAHDVKKPMAWVRTAASNGTLRKALGKARDEASGVPIPSDLYRMPSGRQSAAGARADQWWR